LRGLHAYARFDQQGFDAAAASFSHALELDAKFAPAAEMLALTYRHQTDMGFLPRQTGWEQARAAATLALKLDPGSGLAHAILGNIYGQFDWDWAAAEREFSLAVGSQYREGRILAIAAMDRMAVGDLPTAERYLDEAILTDPLNPATYRLRGDLYARLGRFAEAEQDRRRVLDIAPTYRRAHYRLGSTLLLAGNTSGALAEMQQESSPVARHAGLALVYSALGRTKDAETLCRTLEEESPVDAARAHAVRHQNDQALTSLERAYTDRDPDLYRIKGDPFLRNLEGDPRYNAFLRKMNLPE
jgi:tetratricopeptide (TPR) repeat protein